MSSRVAVADESPGLGVEVLLGVADALAEGGRHRLVEDENTGAGTGGDVHAVEAGVVVGTTGADGPDLARRERVGADLVFTAHFRGEDELLYSILADTVREVGVAELGRPDALLLLFDAAPNL